MDKSKFKIIGGDGVDLPYPHLRLAFVMVAFWILGFLAGRLH